VQEARFVNRSYLVRYSAWLALICGALSPACSSQKPAQDERDERRPRALLFDRPQPIHTTTEQSHATAEIAEYQRDRNRAPGSSLPGESTLAGQARPAAVETIDLGAPVENEAIALTAPAALPVAAEIDHEDQPSPDEVAPAPVNAQDHAAGPITVSEAMAALRSALAAQFATTSQPLRDHLFLAALAIADPNQQLDADRLNDLPQDHRDLVAGFEVFFRRLGEEAAASGEEAAMLQLLEDLKLAIEGRPPLAIAAAHFCTRVDGFGRYQTFDRSAFLLGRAQQVVIYTEIEGFTSARNEDDLWETDLWQALAIHGPRDIAPVWQQDWQPAPDVAARKRTDFFISYIITLPEFLPVGQYTMMVRVKDAANGAIAEAGIAFSIVADAKLAATVPD